MTAIEIIAALLGLACVWLTVRRHIACWPTGLAMVILYIFVFYKARLYSDMLLQIVYVFLQLYGWYAWLYGGPQRDELPISRLPGKQAAPLLVIGLIGTVFLGGYMHVRTDASFPYLDALVAVASLIAQWLMGRKVLESWLVWIFVDVLSIGLFLAKELYPTAGLYAVFLGMAMWGWFEWRQVWNRPSSYQGT